MAKSQTITKEPAPVHVPPAGGNAAQAQAAAGIGSDGTGTAMVPYVPKNVTVKKLVTIPVVKVPDGATIAVKLLAGFHKGKEIEKDKKVADLINVNTFDLDGRVVTRVLVAGHIVKSEIEAQYPKESYVGKWFIIRKMPKPEGKRYKVYDIAEIEDPTGQNP